MIPWNANGHTAGGSASFVGKQFSITVFTEIVTGVPLYPEGGGNKFLQNFGFNLPDCTVSYSRRPSL